jgi:hypothetical protein
MARLALSQPFSVSKAPLVDGKSSETAICAVEVDFRHHAMTGTIPTARIADLGISMVTIQFVLDPMTLLLILSVMRHFR